MLLALRKCQELPWQRRVFLSWAISCGGQLSRTLGDKQSNSVSRDAWWAQQVSTGVSKMAQYPDGADSSWPHLQHPLGTKHNA